MKKLIMIMGCVVTLVGCDGNFHQVDQGSTGFLPAVSHAPVRVTVNHSVDTNQYKPMVYVNIQMHGVANWAEYQDYMMQGIKHLGFFEQVITNQPTVYINAYALTPTDIVDDQPWLDVDREIPFRSLVQQYGTHFLVIDAELYSRASDSEDLNSYSFSLKLIEPKTKRVLMMASNQMYVREGIDKGIINPVLDFTLGYLRFYDSTYSDKLPEPKSFEEWWEQLSDDFVKVMFV